MEKRELLQKLGFSDAMINAIENYEAYGVIDYKPFEVPEDDSFMTATSAKIDSKGNIVFTPSNPVVIKMAK